MGVMRSLPETVKVTKAKGSFIEHQGPLTQRPSLRSGLQVGGRDQKSSLVLC